jgi:hypothetical protein
MVRRHGSGTGVTKSILSVGGGRAEAKDQIEAHREWRHLPTFDSRTRSQPLTTGIAADRYTLSRDARLSDTALRRHVLGVTTTAVP